MERQVELALAHTKGAAGAVARVLRDGKPSLLLVVGGDEPKGQKASQGRGERDFRKSMSAAARALASANVADATIAVDGFDVPGKTPTGRRAPPWPRFLDAAYRFTAYKSKNPRRPSCAA